jgi:hypothetical protein
MNDYFKKKIEKNRNFNSSYYGESILGKITVNVPKVIEYKLNDIKEQDPSMTASRVIALIVTEYLTSNNQPITFDLPDISHIPYEEFAFAKESQAVLSLLKDFGQTGMYSGYLNIFAPVMGLSKEQVALGVRRLIELGLVTMIKTKSTPMRPIVGEKEFKLVLSEEMLIFTGKESPARKKRRLLREQIAKEGHKLQLKEQQEREEKEAQEVEESDEE